MSTVLVMPETIPNDPKRKSSAKSAVRVVW